MNSLVRLLDIAKIAHIPRSFVARSLNISRATLYVWKVHGVPVYREPQIQALYEKIKHCIDAGILPVSNDVLIWKGLVHVTECERELLCNKP